MLLLATHYEIVLCWPIFIIVVSVVFSMCVFSTRCKLQEDGAYMFSLSFYSKSITGDKFLLVTRMKGE